MFKLTVAILLMNRYFFDVSSDVLVYMMVWLAFMYDMSGNMTGRIDPSDYEKFQVPQLMNCCWCCWCGSKHFLISKDVVILFFIQFQVVTIGILVMGSVFVVLFHILTPETPWHPDPSEMLLKNSTEDNIQAPPTGAAESEDLSLRVNMTWRDWLLEPQFYYVSE